MGEITDVISTIKKLNASLNRLSKSNINDEDEKAIKDFIFSIRNEKTKPEENTLIAHINALKRACEIIAEIGIKKTMAEIDQADFSQFLMYLEDLSASNKAT